MPDAGLPAGSNVLRDALVVVGALLACAVLFAVSAALSGCTIERVILYETVNTPPPIAATPIGRVGPSS
jgi:hypothetical protein